LTVMGVPFLKVKVAAMETPGVSGEAVVVAR
jgi:hypothetical protein